MIIKIVFTLRKARWSTPSGFFLLFFIALCLPRLSNSSIFHLLLNHRVKYCSNWEIPFENDIAMTEVKATTYSPIAVLRISIGIIYLWFGILKFFFGLSPAEQVASQTIHQLTFGLLPDHVAILTLALWECSLGVLFICCKWMRAVLIMMFIHMAFTFTPFLLFPHQTFMHLPYDFTLLGQYIMKNIIIISSGVVLWQHYVSGLPHIYSVPFSERS
jgi:uncharacterized membrane protein YphA (DoxX/SURF4 family)